MDDDAQNSEKSYAFEQLNNNVQISLNNSPQISLHTVFNI